MLISRRKSDGIGLSKWATSGHRLLVYGRVSVRPGNLLAGGRHGGDTCVRGRGLAVEGLLQS